MRTIYMCEKCGKEFSDWETCYDHETSHIIPVAYNVKATEYLYHDESIDVSYPWRIEVPMNNGITVKYAFDSIITPDPPQEEPEEIRPEVTE